MHYTGTWNDQLTVTSGKIIANRSMSGEEFLFEFLNLYPQEKKISIPSVNSKVDVHATWGPSSMHLSFLFARATTRSLSLRR